MATASDDFNRANETPLAGNWTNPLIVTDRWNLTSNQVVPSALADDALAIWNAASFGNDQFSQVTLSVTGTAGGRSGAGVVLRSNGLASSTQYRVVIDHAATNNVAIDRFNAGASVNLKQVTQAFTNGDTFSAEISGFVITVKLNGAVVTTFDDSASGSKIASGSPGIGYSSTETAASIDNWQGGDLGGAAPVGDAVLWSDVSGPGADYGPYAFIEALAPIPALTAQSFPQAVTADVVAVTASMLKQVNKLMTATSLAVTASMLRSVGKLMSSTAVAVTASIVKQVNKALTSTAVAVTASLATVKVKLLAMTATAVVVTASMLKQVNKLLTATTVAVTASMIKQVNKALSATAVAVTATLSTVKVKLVAMTATSVVVTASMLRQVQTHLTAPSVALSATITKQVNKRLTATTVAVTAALTSVKVKLLAMTATTVAVSASMVRRIAKTLSASSVVSAVMSAISSAVSAFFSAQFDPSVGRGISGDDPQEADYTTDPHGNIRSKPHQGGFDS